MDGPGARLPLPAPARLREGPLRHRRPGTSRRRRRQPVPVPVRRRRPSGGSVGIVSAVAQHLAPVDEPTDWVRALGDDHVGPLLSKAVLGELTLSPTGLAPGHDRAEVLIDGWASTFTRVRGTACSPLAGKRLDDVGFLQVQALCPGQVPLMLLNGTIVRTGQRFNISPLDGSAAVKEEIDHSWAGGSVDLRDVLCPTEDIGLFDAAFLSARFPLATPSGHLLGGDGCPRDVESGVDVVDGGYLENSGAGQIAELYGVLVPLLARAANVGAYRPVQPLIVEIENGEHSGTPDKAPELRSKLAEPLPRPPGRAGNPDRERPNQGGAGRPPHGCRPGQGHGAPVRHVRPSGPAATPRMGSQHADPRGHRRGLRPRSQPAGGRRLRHDDGAVVT